MNSSFKIGRIFGINVEINPSWLLVLSLFSLSLAEHYFPSVVPGLGAVAYWTLGISTTLLIFVSVLVHELSHSLIAIREKIPIRKITLFIFGGVAQMEKEPETSSSEFKITIFGPLASFALALLLGIAFFLMEPGQPLTEAIKFLGRINLIMGAVNLIPAFPLDGGRILRAILWHRTKNLLEATRIAAGVGSVFAFIAIGLGFLMLFQFAWVWGLWYIFLGWMLYQAGQASYSQLIFRQTFSGISVAEIMSPGVHTVQTGLTVRQLVDEFYRFKFGAFPVVDENENLKGMVSLNQVRELSQKKWKETKVAEIMTPLRECVMVAPEQEAVEIMMKMAVENLGRILVMENENLIGILTKTDMMRLVKMHMLLGTE